MEAVQNLEMPAVFMQSYVSTISWILLRHAVCMQAYMRQLRHDLGERFLSDPDSGEGDRYPLSRAAFTKM